MTSLTQGDAKRATADADADSLGLALSSMSLGGASESKERETKDRPGLLSRAGLTRDAPVVAIGDSVKVGSMSLTVGRALYDMEDSTHLKDQPEELVKVIARDGYALIRGYLDRNEVLAARKVVTESLDKEWELIDSSEERIVDDAYIKKGQRGVLLTGYRGVTHNEHVQKVLEGKQLAGFFAQLFGAAPATFDNKWVRIHGKGESTDEHTDYYRFSGNARGMYTCWIPFGDYNVKQGCLAVCERSHLLKGYEASVYGNETKVELPPDYQRMKETAVWRSTSFRAGDICVFDIRTVHASTQNTTDRFRISMDTRWQPAAFVPMQTRGMFKAFAAAASAPAAAASDSSSAGAASGASTTAASGSAGAAGAAASSDSSASAGSAAGAGAASGSAGAAASAAGVASSEIVVG